MVKRAASQRGSHRGPPSSASPAAGGPKAEIRNVNHPGQVKYVDAELYSAMRGALLRILPKTSPGLTEVDIRGKVLAHLPQDLFPGGAKAGWWTKAVQLDLEARDLVVQEKTKPLRWHTA